VTGADLEDLRPEGRRIGRRTARHAKFRGATRFAQLQAGKPVLLTGTAFHGPLDLRDAHLDGGLSVHDATFDDEVVLAGAVVGTSLDVGTEPPDHRTGSPAVGENTRVDGDAGPWIAEPVP